MTKQGSSPCSDVMVVCVVLRPCIIITCFKLVFWVCILYFQWVFCFFIYKAPFLIFGLQVLCCFVQKTRLTSRMHFFQLIFRVKYVVGVFCERPNYCFKWRGLMNGVRQLWEGDWLGPPPPHPPPSARRLFIGFQNHHWPKSTFQRSKLQFPWPFFYKKSVSTKIQCLKQDYCWAKPHFHRVPFRGLGPSLFVYITTAV